MAMTSEQRKSLMEFLNGHLENKKKALDLYKTFPEKFLDLGILHLVLPAQDKISELEIDIEKLIRQIELLHNPAIENMTDEEFKKHINS